MSDYELVVARERLHALYDQLWVLECAIDDVEHDLARSATRRDHQEALAWLLDAARPLLALRS